MGKLTVEESLDFLMRNGCSQTEYDAYPMVERAITLLKTLRQMCAESGIEWGIINTIEDFLERETFNFADAETNYKLIVGGEPAFRTNDINLMRQHIAHLTFQDFEKGLKVVSDFS